MIAIWLAKDVELSLYCCSHARRHIWTNHNSLHLLASGLFLFACFPSYLDLVFSSFVFTSYPVVPNIVIDFSKDVISCSVTAKTQLLKRINPCKSSKIKVFNGRSTYRGMCVHIMFLSMFSRNHISTDSAFFQIAGTMCIMQVNIWSWNSFHAKIIIELSVVHVIKLEEQRDI